MLREKLRVMSAGPDDVWKWQAEGNDPRSLSCPVVMSADTFREYELARVTLQVPWEDKPLPEDDAMLRAFPTRSGEHDVWAEAMRLVGACHSKMRLVKLVNWLLLELKRARRT